MSGRESFERAIHERPYDDFPKLVFADWLEERGDVECEAWRWLCKFKKRPFLRGSSGAVWKGYTVGWYYGNTWSDSPIALPVEFKALSSGRIARFDGSQSRIYRTAGEAFIDAAKTFAILYRNCWRPPRAGSPCNVGEIAVIAATQLVEAIERARGNRA